MSAVARVALVLPLLAVSASAAESPYDAPRGRRFFESAKGIETLRRGYVPDEILVRLVPGREARAEQTLRRLGARMLGRNEATGVLHYQLPRRLGARDALAELRVDPAFLRAEPNHVVRTCAVPPSDPLFPQLWGLRNTGQVGGRAGADVHALAAWDISTGSREVVVAVLDSGFDYTHPDLGDNAWVNPGEVPGNGLDDDANGYVDDVHGIDAAEGATSPGDPGSNPGGHGTHVAGTIGAVGDNGIGVVGVSPVVRIMGIRSMLQAGTGLASELLRGIDYVIRMKRDRGVNIRALNASFQVDAAELPQLIYESMRSLGEQGVLVVAAAGNQASDDDVVPHWPASFDLDNVIAVAATDPNDELALFPGSGGSNWGATSVDVAAPGTDILSTLPGGTYGPKSGTSMATPHVTGLVALLAAHEPQLTAAEIKARILSTVDVKPNLQGMILTGGRVNAWRALGGEDRSAPSVTVVSPNGGLALAGGQLRAITWSVDDESELARADVDWSADGGATWEEIASDAPPSGSLPWRVPDVATSAGLVRVAVEDVFGNRGEDRSDAVFPVAPGPAPADTTPPIVNLVSPNGGETLEGGGSVTIVWTATDDVGVVSVDVQWTLDPKGWSWNSVASGLPNSGSYQWYIPATSSTTARVRVTAWDAAGNSRADTSSTAFTLVRKSRAPETTPPVVTVLQPNGGEVWRSGETRVVAWSAQDNYAVSRTNVYCSLDAGATWALLAAGLNHASSLAFVVPDLAAPATAVVFRVEAYDPSNNRGEDRSDGPLTLQPRNIPPTAAAGADITPLKGALVTLDGRASSDPDDGIASWLWEQLSGPPVTLSGATSPIATFTAPDAVGAVLVFQLTVRDAAGQAATDTVQALVLDPAGGTGVVRVRTLTKTGALRTGVWVQVRQTSGGTFQASAKTNYRGEALFQSLGAGQYEVSRQTSMGFGDKRLVNVGSGEVVVEYRY